MLLAAEAFPHAPLRWGGPIKIAPGTAPWCLASPFVVPVPVLMGSGVFASAALLGVSAVRYIRLGRGRRHVGSFLIGGGLAAICVANVVGAAVMLHVIDAADLLNRVAVLNVI